ncbi:MULTISPECIES: hypothetical protein [Halobacterium]|uniref:DUF7860 family protein n=1 Tax=Halobacterium TaxID=2239 RepID=UPI00073EA5AF|nr:MULTISPECIES: hypothetical protein [Halobacterium]MCG1004289.1 hypothetical protein [Halobacterium noricense]
MGRYGNLDYSSLVKRSTLASFALFVVGALGLALGGGSLPAWEHALLFDAEIIGVLGILVCPLVFGIVLPLTE